MRFEEAKQQVKDLVGDAFAVVEYSEYLHSDGTKPKCRIYVEKIGHTEYYGTWEEALTALENMSIGVPREYQGPQ